MVISLRPTRLVKMLVIAAIAVVLAGLVVQVLYFLEVGLDRSGWSRIFALNIEGNFPTWFSAMLLLIRAILLAAIARGSGRTRDARYWTALALVFTLLSADEASRFHEQMSDPLRAALDIPRTGGALSYAWIIPGALFAGAVLLLYWRFLDRLPRTTRTLFITAGVIYAGAAMGGEVIQGYLGDWYFSDDRGDRLGIELIIAVEEALEMTGALLFIYALLGYLETRGPRLTVDLAPSTAAAPPPPPLTRRAARGRGRSRR